VEAACPWFGSKLNGTLMSFASERFVDSGRERGFSAGRMGAPGPACPETVCRWRSPEAAEARGQPRLKKIEMIVSAVIARSARARSPIEDRSLVILIVPLCPLGILREFTWPGFPSGFLATINNSSFGAVSLMSFHPSESPAIMNPTA
jgi:hypothetical protein